MQSAPPRLAARAAAPISARSRTSRSVSVPTITRAAPWETARRAASAVRHAGVEPDRQSEGRDRLDDGAVIAGAGDRVEVRHVAGVRAEALAEAASERDRVRRVRQHALDRRVGMTLAPHRVDRDAALEIQHRHDPHRGGG